MAVDVEENRLGIWRAAEVEGILVARVQFRRTRTPTPLANMSFGENGLTDIFSPCSHRMT